MYQEVTRLLNCRHWFHSQCVDLWLRQKAFCPNCYCPVGMKEVRGRNIFIAGTLIESRGTTPSTTITFNNNNSGRQIFLQARTQTSTTITLNNFNSLDRYPQCIYGNYSSRTDSNDSDCLDDVVIQFDKSEDIIKKKNDEAKNSQAFNDQTIYGRVYINKKKRT